MKSALLLLHKEQQNQKQTARISQVAEWSDPDGEHTWIEESHL